MLTARTWNGYRAISCSSESGGRPKKPHTRLLDGRGAAWRIVRKASQDLGMSGIHPHVFRHWRGTQMLRQGVPIEQVQRYLNHCNIQTTRLYAKAVERTVERAAAMTDPL